ncbi:MAG TPA: amidohydrolase family protein [Solirubrobacteraceae bacterium]|nr:amidohydrolase family protein [Solirubrobacteraceae bacterium]
MESRTVIAPWLEAVRQQVPGLELFDAHTHIGANDPDGFQQSAEELIELLHEAEASGCFVFPMHEPAGYPAANDLVIEEAQRSGGLLVPFCRVKPGEGALAEAERALDRGAAGIKLHPRAEQFTLDHPDVRSLFALADERTLPILIHAGRGIPALGEHVVALAHEYANARPILAHAGISDLAWIWRIAPEHPNLLFDTAWWQPGDQLALFALVPPAQILFASDSPYGTTAVAAACQLRLALQAGMAPEQIRLMAAGQARHIATGQPLAVAGPAPGERDRAGRVLLDRLGDLLQTGMMLALRAHQGADMLALARLACEVPPEIDDAPLFTAILRLLDAYDAVGSSGQTRRTGLSLLGLALTIARTPDVPLPAAVALPDQP